MSTQFRPDSSSLVDLKAEVYRKKEEAKRNKARRIYDESNYVPQVKKGAKKVELNKEPSPIRDDETEEFSKVQEALRKKAALYEHLKDSREDPQEGLRDRFLVQFNDKEFEDSEDLVEYTDPLGRTRQVRRYELEKLRKEDTSWCERDSSQHQDNEIIAPLPKEEDPSEENMKRELLRQKWSQEEEENLRKRDVHYGDLLFNEARTHGTGYYGFSREEALRSKEIDALKDIHKETESAQAESQRSEKVKSRQLASRLKKVRERKRLKMGLPIRPAGVEEGDVEEKEESDNNSGDEKTDKKLEESIAQSVRDMRDKRDAQDRKRKFVREWDLGKKDTEIMSQDDWVREKRIERHAEFAPSYSNMASSSSSSYNSMELNCLKSYSQYTSSSSSSSKTFNQKRGSEIPPPIFNEPSKLSKPNLLESFKMGLKEKDRKHNHTH